MTHPLSSMPETDAFAVADLLYSRTDLRGVIKSTNAAFRRVSEFEWEGLLNAPHRVVRHPGMPKGAFHLMWAHLLAGEPIGLYVVNQTQSKMAYTVFAVAMRLGDELISVRLKPTTPFVAQVKQLYDALAAREVAEDLTPEASATILQDEIARIGRGSYRSFMADALEQELSEWNRRRSVTPLRDIGALSAIDRAIGGVSDVVSQLDDLLRNSDQIPYNMRLQASRLEGRGGPISVISSNHQAMTMGFTQSLDQFFDTAKKGVGLIKHAKFLCGTSELLRSVSAHLSQEQGMDPALLSEDLDAMGQLQVQNAGNTEQAVRDVAHRAELLDRACRDMRRMVLGIEMTRTMCNIERVNAHGDTTALDGIVSRLGQTEVKLTQMMTEIGSSVDQMKQGVDTLMTGQQRQRQGALI
ncbi:MAG: hypothetical protein AAFN94_01335 [Pseudomonadota bacterium]